MIPKQEPVQLPAWATTFSFLVGSVGFPIAVSFWLLWRIVPILEQQTRLLERLLMLAGG